ncbi:unnamed protein product, partial [Amoebophrya sp. A120]|eukprot:GSA120T00022615001.1
MHPKHDRRNHLACCASQIYTIQRFFLGYPRLERGRLDLHRQPLGVPVDRLVEVAPLRLHARVQAGGTAGQVRDHVRHRVFQSPVPHVRIRVVALLPVVHHGHRVFLPGLRAVRFLLRVEGNRESRVV